MNSGKRKRDASPHSPSKKERQFIDLTGSEFSEDEVGEQELELDDDHDLANGVIPIRRLDSFSIRQSGRLVLGVELLGPIEPATFTATGIVRAHYINDKGAVDNDDDDFSQSVIALEILEFNVYDISNGKLDA
ncbi:hypothetical protein MKEN_00906700 [Mycena kentingensis (nom. inval.)]|nr:hypothetical protein MKEN_00906700 [Mycena kentingensis (nom. inval.)]